MITPGKFEWADFLEDVDTARRELRCSISSAWYRGHQDINWLLYPTLIRHFVSYPESVEIKNKDREIIIYKLTKLINPHSPAYLNLTLRQINQAADIIADYERLKIEAKALKRDCDNISRIRSEAGQASRDQSYISYLKYDEFSAMCQKNNLLCRPFSNDKISITEAIKSIKKDDMDKAEDINRKKIFQLDLSLSKNINKIKSIVSIIPGEKEAFIDFNFRWKSDLGNSWQVLARMQHYGVLTRLLDWSENLSVGIWFALEKYIDLYNKLKDKSKSLSDLME